MATLIIPFYLFSRPLTSFARQTQTDGEILPPRPAEAKTSIASRYYQCLCLGRSPRQKVSVVCVLSAVKIFAYLSNPTGIIGSFH